MKASNASSESTRTEYWRSLLQQQEASGESVHAFCATRGLTEQSLYYWRKRLKGEPPVSFALVRTGAPPEALSEEPLQLDLGASRRLLIPRGVDAATLRTVLTILREQA
jgi:hypothetical protein